MSVFQVIFLKITLLLVNIFWATLWLLAWASVFAVVHFIGRAAYVTRSW